MSTDAVGRALHAVDELAVRVEVVLRTLDGLAERVEDVLRTVHGLAERIEDEIAALTDAIEDDREGREREARIEAASRRTR